MSDDLTPLSLPTTLPYPITLTRLHAKPSQSILRGAPLISYTFTSSTNARELTRLEKGLPLTEGIRREDVRQGDMSATWECGLEGEFVRYEQGIEVGRVVERKHASKSVVWLKQPCTHPVQLHGLCGICGADLTSDDYLSTPSVPQAGPSRHGGFEMSHDAMGVTVSSNEAKRLDSLTRDTLLTNRKLSLIVDLDQTIIHTTVDPTVGDWMADIEREEEEELAPPPLPVSSPNAPDSEEKGKGKSQEVEGGEMTTTPPGSPPRPAKRKREPNPNADALKDVAKFTLADDPAPGRGRRQTPERYYYTKPRPGLQSFLDSMSEYYEMHVYTMGTRTYADAICKVIDPGGRIFGDRILSRDESGNFTSKNLKRLFPTDQSMVVVIDDRQDVWGDCPNLLKVVPYDFFIGIGDINSSFLPPTPKPPPTTPPSSSPASTAPPLTPEMEVESTSEEDGLLLQKKLMDDVSEARPLAKLQEQLEETGALDSGAVRGTAGGDETAAQQEGKDVISESIQEVQPSRKPLLNNIDNELDRLARILRQVHTNFYDAFDARPTSDLHPLPLGCDVEVIVPELKAQVLRGCHLIFSGLISRLEPPESSAIWQAAEAFGAIPSMSLTNKVTHCIAASLGTEKTYRASKLGVPVLWQGWFWESINLWEKQDEKIWLAIPEQATGPTPGPSTPTTPALPPLSLVSEQQAQAQTQAQGEEKGETFEGDEGLGEGWDDEAQAELDAFLDGSSDWGSDAGSERSVRTDVSREGTPGTPSKKRVRYADEEQLPLETFKDPSPNHIPSPPKKKSKPLLLEAPSGDEGISDANKFTYKASGSYGSNHASKEEVASAADDIAAEDEEDGDDDFARMLQAEMEEEDE